MGFLQDARQWRQRECERKKPSVELPIFKLFKDCGCHRDANGPNIPLIPTLTT